MAHPILLPRQGQSVESCIITEFYVKPGDKVEPDTPLFSYETDKASFEEEAKESGTLLTWFFEEGDEVPVLTNVGVIGEEGESIDEFRPENATALGSGGDSGEAALSDDIDASVSGDRSADADINVASGEANPEKGAKNVSSIKTAPAASAGAKIAAGTPSAVGEGQSTAASGATSQNEQGKLFISPRARKLAEAKHINIYRVQGTGPNGRIIEADIRKAMEHEPSMVDNATGAQIQAAEKAVVQQQAYQYPDPSNAIYDNDSKNVPLTNMRKRIANAMHVSLQNSAQLTHHLGADARRILELRQQVKAKQNEGYEHNITLNDMVCTAVIRTLKKHQNANAHFLGDSTRVFQKVHLGFAVDTERGLMVPTVKNADDLAIEGLSSQMKSLANACKKGSVNPDLLAPTEASFTVSNLGNYGVEMFTPVINLPQVAILGVNTILPRPKDLGNGTYGFVPTMGLSLTYDHRALDGGEATRFLKAIATEIENLEINI
ncbi:MAG TPA: dihydrolipoamide acetyltransferase family protein [Bacteroidales bacterium]|nr:dihydrolipoamide acetyltransferase family protein [Bacteroidales bacterium]